MHHAPLITGADAVPTNTARVVRFHASTRRRQFLGAIRHPSYFLSIQGGGEERFREIQAGYRE